MFCPQLKSLGFTSRSLLLGAMVVEPIRHTTPRSITSVIHHAREVAIDLLMDNIDAVAPVCPFPRTDALSDIWREALWAERKHFVEAVK